MKLFLFFPMMIYYGVLFAGLAPKEAYQPIIDAKPFGDMAALVDTDTTSIAEQQKQKEELAQKFRMCGITDMPDGSRKIAFLDETSGQMASYLLGLGETQNGFTLLSADYVHEYATLSKDGLVFTLGLGKSLIDTPVPKAEEMTELKVVTPAPVVAPKGSKTLPEGSFRSRLLMRRAAQAEADASEKKALQDRVAAAEAEKIKAARRVQIERIRQGLAPTQPITLTPEEDAELEAAGAFADRAKQQKPEEGVRQESTPQESTHEVSPANP